MSDSSAPKKLKLTLKLNSSSSSSSSPSDSKTPSTPATAVTTPVPSTTVSPVKLPESSTSGLSELLLPSGLGNLKGRGRPKKTAEPLISDNNGGSTVSTITTTTNSTITATTTNTPSIPASNPDYTADLKTLVNTMNTFKPRSWSLTRPAHLNNLAGFAVEMTCGMWGTIAEKPASMHLAVIAAAAAESTSATSNPTSKSADTAFEATCQCGKVFNDRSKYRKHAKIHDKPVATSTSTSDQNVTSPIDQVKVTSPAATPTISLKIKLNTKQQQV